MNNASFEFNKKLELDVLITGLTDVEVEYVRLFDTDNLREVIIPKGVERIGRYAFAWCDRLTNVTIPDSVTKIEANAFCSCKSLRSVTIPANVTYIGWEAFCWCDNLKTVVFKDRTPDEIRSMESYPWGIQNLKKASIQVS